MTISKKKKTKTKVKTNKTKKPVKKTLVKHPNKLSVKELQRRTSKIEDNLYRAIIHILNEDGLHPQEAPFVSYVLNMIFKYDVLFDETTSPYFSQLNKDLGTNLNEDDFDYYQDVLQEVINRQDFLSATRNYISGTAGGKYKSKLKTINQSWRK